MEQEILLFLHIPKTAGTTLKTLIDKNYKFNEIHNAYDYKDWENGISLLPNKDQIKIIQGHFRYGYHNNISPIKYRYFTFLRNPIQLTISHYSHLVNSSSEDHKDRLKGIESLLDFSKIHSSYNLQTRFLCGVYDIDEFKKNETENFNKAIDVLQNEIDIIGIQEYFDESVLALSNLLDWKKNKYITLNVGQKNNKELSAEVIDSITAHNQLDMKLYQIALQKFESQNKQILNFNFKVKFYRFSKSIFSYIHPLYIKVKNSFNFN